MCGFVGIFNKKNNIAINDSLNLIKHRGPDNGSIWSDDYCILGHNRLKIIDLSDDANQPFHYERYHLVFNGEIYNFLELKQHLESKGIVFKTTSDTEVLIASYALYGKKCIDYLEGMFAFAIYDEENKSVFIARDRIGEKPLYYTKQGETLYVASEIKSLLSLKEIKDNLKISFDAILGYFATTYNVPPPFTMYENIYKLEPGYAIEFQNGVLKKYKYWDLSNISPFQGTFKEAVDKLDELLNRSVKNCLIADLPVSTMLSGGVDSSLVTAIASKYKNHIQTFSLGIGEDDPEIQRSLTISNLFNTNHKNTIYDELLLENALKDLEEIVEIYDEPINLFPMIYANYLYKNIKKDTTVCLSGNGADEMFGGYYGYDLFFKKYLLLKIPSFIISLLPVQKTGFLELLSTCYSRKDDENLINISLFSSLFRRIKKFDPLKLFPVFNYLNSYLSDLSEVDIYQKKFFLDLIHNNHAGVAMIADGVPMKHSLELRAPFLNHKIIEFALSLPKEFLIGESLKENKKIVKKLAERYLPKNIIYAKKMGFGYSVNWREVISKKLSNIDCNIPNKNFNEIKIQCKTEIEKLMVFSLQYWVERYG